jgi:hypothetical protein
MLALRVLNCNCLPLVTFAADKCVGPRQRTLFCVIMFGKSISLGKKLPVTVSVPKMFRSDRNQRDRVPQNSAIDTEA